MSRIDIAMITEAINNSFAGMFTRAFCGNNRTAWSQFINQQRVQIMFTSMMWNFYNL